MFKAVEIQRGYAKKFDAAVVLSNPADGREVYDQRGPVVRQEKSYRQIAALQDCPIAFYKASS